MTVWNFWIDLSPSSLALSPSLAIFAAHTDPLRAGRNHGGLLEGASSSRRPGRRGALTHHCLSRCVSVDSALPLAPPCTATGHFCVCFRRAAQSCCLRVRSSAAGARAACTLHSFISLQPLSTLRCPLSTQCSAALACASLDSALSSLDSVLYVAPCTGTARR